MKATAAALALLIGLLSFSLNDRGLMEAKFLKYPGSTFLIRDEMISNTYTFTIINKANQDLNVQFRVLNSNSAKVELYQPSPINLKRNTIKKGDLKINFPENEIQLSKQSIEIGVFDTSGKMITSYKTIFEGPFKFKF